MSKLSLMCRKRSSEDSGSSRKPKHSPIFPQIQVSPFLHIILNTNRFILEPAVISSFTQLLEECIDVWNERFGTDTRGKPTKYKSTYNDVATKVKMPTKRALFDVPQEEDSMEEQKVDPRSGGREDPYNQSSVRSPPANPPMNQSVERVPPASGHKLDKSTEDALRGKVNVKNEEILKNLSKIAYMKYRC